MTKSLDPHSTIMQLQQQQQQQQQQMQKISNFAHASSSSSSSTSTSSSLSSSSSSECVMVSGVPVVSLLRIASTSPYCNCKVEFISLTFPLTLFNALFRIFDCGMCVQLLEALIRSGA